MYKLLFYFISLIYWNNKSIEKVKKMQLRKFREIFEYARTNSPFYRDLYTKCGVIDLKIKSWDDIKKIPIIDKDLLRKYGLQETMTRSLLDKDIVRCSTSGSSGEPFQLAYSKFANYSAYLRVFYIMWKVGKYNPFKRLVILSKYEVDEIFKVEKNISIIKKLQDSCGLLSRKIISVFDDRKNIVKKLIQYKPDILYSSSSAVEIVANYLLETNQTLQIPNIVLIAEPLSYSQYKKFKKCFGANIIDIYGAKESPSMGFEVNKEGVFHLFPNSNLFEFIDIQQTEEGEKGTTVITNLLNKTQPFIRYNLKDYGDILKRDDFPTKVIGPIIGRISDILSFPDGNKLFHYCISQRYIDFHMAAQYKFIQIDNGPITMKILPASGFNLEDIRQEAIRRWKLSYPSYDLKVEFVESFEIDKKTGKFKVIEHINSKS